MSKSYEKQYLVDGKYTFIDLVDIEQLRHIFERFSAATGFTAGLVTYPEQRVLITSGWRRVCTDFHRKCSASSVYCTASNVSLTSQLKKRRTLNILPCENGLVDGATPVIINGVHVASLATGQVFIDTPPDLARFKEQAQRYGFDEDDYLQAVSEVPVIKRQAFEQALLFLSELAVLLAAEGLKALQQKQVEERLHQSEQRYRTFFENSNDAMIICKNGIIVDCNNAAVSLLKQPDTAAIINKSPSQLSPQLQPDGSESATKARQMLDIAATRGSHLFEWDHICPDSTIVPVEISATAIPEGNSVVIHGVLRDISSRRMAMEQLEHQALHHPLTGLPNRLLLGARLEHSIQYAKREDTSGALLLLDLDDFKKINDSMGHSTGDEVLRIIAARLLGHVRDVDTVAHISGDEFVVVFQSINTMNDASAKAQHILHGLQAPFTLHGHELFISASIGIVAFDGNSSGLEELLQKADATMYEAKKKGKNCYNLYAAEVTESALDKVRMESSLRRALERNELVAYYQPQISLRDGRIIAVETLMRWNHPRKGLLMPDTFIPLSEETGLIIPMGEWILRTACQQLVDWRKQGLHIERVAVNLSGRQLQPDTLPQMVHTILEQTGCPPQALELEITESFIMRHPERSIAMLKQIQQLGVELSVDDFGTGHSSLNYLKRLPINRLKIDRSFVWDIGSDQNGEILTRAIIAMGHGLGLHITAEGIETEEQKAFLNALSCNEAQGYLYSKPVPAATIGELLRHQPFIKQTQRHPC